MTSFGGNKLELQIRDAMYNDCKWPFIEFQFRFQKIMNCEFESIRDVKVEPENPDKPENPPVQNVMLVIKMKLMVKIMVIRVKSMVKMMVTVKTSDICGSSDPDILILISEVWSGAI